MKNLHYTIRSIKMTDDETHYCSGHIVAVLGSTRNPETGTWYMTVLVERQAGQAPEEN